MAYTEQVYAGEWLKWMVERRYCLQIGTITAVGAATDGLDSGQVMEGAVGSRAAVASGPATSILIEPVTLAEHIAGCKKLMLFRGPAVVDTDLLVTADPSDLTDLAALLIVASNSALATWNKLADA